MPAWSEAVNRGRSDRPSRDPRWVYAKRPCPLLGTLLGVLPALVVAGPALVPTMVSLGFEPLHVATVVILTLNVANITPSVGMMLITASRIANVPCERAIIETIPFFLSHMVVILLVTFFQAIALWLPGC